MNKQQRNAFMKAYRQSDKYKASQKAYLQSDKYKAYQKAYLQSDKYKTKVNERLGRKANMAEYLELMRLEKRSRRQQIRLEVIAELLGREIEEWRSPEEKETHIRIMDEWNTNGE